MIEQKTGNNDTSLSEDALLLQAQQGDSHCFTLLVKQYMPLIHSQASSFSSLEKEDLIQEGLIGFIKAVRSYDAGKQVSFKYYALLCVSSQMKSFLKKSYSTKRHPLQRDFSFDLLDEVSDLADPSAEDVVLCKENIQLLNEQMESLLSEFEQDALRLYLSGHSYMEMATILNTTSKAVDNALQRIRRKLRADCS